MIPLSRTELDRLILDGNSRLYICEDRFLKEDNLSVSVVYRAEMAEIEGDDLIEYSRCYKTAHPLKNYGRTWVAFLGDPLQWRYFTT